MCRGGVTGQGKFPKKMWFFGRFSEQRAKKNSAQINRYNWHFLCSLQVDVIPKKWKQPLIFWIELFDFHILEMQTLPNAKLWSLAGLDLCNLCESASWPVLAYPSTHRCTCACAIGTQPQNILSGWFGEEEVFWRVHRAEKPRQRIQRVLGKTCTDVPCLPGLGNLSWDQNAHRNERTTFFTSNRSTYESGKLLRFNDILWQARYWVSERDQVAFMAYLLYIRISGFHNAEGGIRTSSTLPYSLVFHAKLTSSHSCREIIFNQVEFMWKYFAETTHQI